MIKYIEVVNKTAETLIKASTTFRQDQIEAYERSIMHEDNPHAKWVLNNILKMPI